MSALLELSRVTVRFGGLTAVSNVELAVPAGQIRAIIGPNGAGKTTLFNSISGLVRPADGEMRFDGHDIFRSGPDARARLGIQRTFQSVQLIQEASVLVNVLIGLHAAIPARSLLSVFSFKGFGQAEIDAEERAYDVLRLFVLDRLALEPVASLSFAQQRYVELARALASRPRLLLLDEPAAGLSPPEVEALASVLRRVSRERDVAILLVEHVLSLVLDVSEQITVMDQGRKIAEGPPSAIMEDERVKTAYLGEYDHAAAQ